MITLQAMRSNDNPNVIGVREVGKEIGMRYNIDTLLGKEMWRAFNKTVKDMGVEVEYFDGLQETL